MKKKYFFKFLLITMIGLMMIALSACSGSEESSEETEESGEQVIEVVYRQDSGSAGTEAMLTAGKESFEAANEGWTVEFSPIQAGESDYFTKVALMMGDPETAPDVVMEDIFMLESDAMAGYLYPIDEYVAEWEDWENFYESARNGMVASDGHTYGVPTSTDVRGIWYNYAAFEAAGIPIPWQPHSWQDILDAAYALQASGYTGIPYFGYASTSSGEGTNMQHVLLLLYGTEDELYNYETDKWTVESQGLYDTLCFIDEIYSNGLGPAPEQFVSAQAWSTADALMMEGQVGMMPEGCWKPGGWETSLGWMTWEEEYGFAMFPTQYGQEPGYTTVAGGWSLAVTAHADDPEMAFEYITHCTSYDVMQNQVVEYGGMSTRTDVAEDPEYLEIGVNEQASEMMNYAHYRPALPEYPQVSIEIQAAAEAVATGVMTPEEAMAQYSQNVTRIVGEENVEKNEVVYK